MSVQGIEDRRHRSRWSDTCFSETPTAQYIIYNKKRVVWQCGDLLYFVPPRRRRTQGSLCRSQASKTENSEVAQIAYEVAEQFPQLQIANSQDNGRIQRHKKMALLRGSFTGEEERDKDWRGSTLDHTRRRVCSRVLSCKPRGSTSGCEEPFLRSDRDSFLGKEKKLEAFFFFL